MWLLLKGIALRFAIGRTVGGLLATLLLVLLPLAGALQLVGLPVLIVLGVLGAPLFLLLAAIGLPMLFILGMGGVLLAVLGVLLTLGLLAIKIVVPIVLVVWLVRRLRAKSARHSDRDPEPGSAAAD
jgi:hypothetical protein